MLCDVCKINEARIHISGEGAYCFDCHNARISEQYGYDRLAQYAREITVHDASNRPHRLKITNLLLPHCSEWIADEGDNGYQFSYMAKPGDDQSVALFRLQQKIVAGLQHESLRLHDGEYPLANALQTADGQYCLNTVGSGRIDYDREAGSGQLIIDGRSVSASDFFRMLTAYEGYNLHFQIQELSDAVLGKDTILVPLCIDAENMLSRFEESLSWFLDGDYLSFKNESACSSALFERLDEFELLCRYGKPDTARSVGQALIDRLLAIDHNLDSFPEYHVALINRCLSDIQP